MSIRAVVFIEGPWFIAQCLERDICAASQEYDKLRPRLERTIEAEKRVAAHLGKAIADIPAAPQRFFDLWDKQGGWSLAA